jgi:acetyl-CoA C-acetyltransferase
MPEAYIIDAVRTPRGIGKVGKGSLAGMHPQHVAGPVLKALVERNNLNTADIDDIPWGAAAPGGGNIGRSAALDQGFDIKVGGTAINRACGSGLTAVNFAAAKIMAGMEDLSIAGGTEMMSAPMGPSGGGMMSAPGGNASPMMLDSGNLRLRARHPQSHQGVCADAIATLEGIERQVLDELAVVSQERAANAIKNGYFDRALIPVYHEDGTLALDHEEYPRPGTTLESLSGLKPSFEMFGAIPVDSDGTTYEGMIRRVYPDLRIKYVHHAGNSSGVVDGAAGVLLASPEYAAKHGLKPRARVLALAEIGDSPTLMLNAPVPAAKKALKRAGLTPDDIDLWEVNEAFAVVTEKFIRDLNLDRKKVNVNGGAMALGHPIGATGALLLGTVLDELERRDLKRGLVTLCAAGGMAPAIIIERV